MPDVWLARFSRWMEKLLNAKGGPVLLDVNPSMQVVMSQQPGREDLYLQSVYRFANVIGVGAVAAQQAAVRLRNPSTSGVVGIVELLGIGPAVATTSTFHVNQTGNADGVGDFGAPQRGFRLDSRIVKSSTLLMSGGNGAAIDDAFPLILIASGNNAAVNGIITPTLGLELTILPGDMIQISDQTNNEAFSVELLWRERVLESSELT